MGGRHTDRIGTFRDWLRDAMTGDLDGPRPVGDASKPHSQAVQRLLIKQLCAVIRGIVRAPDVRLRVSVITIKTRYSDQESNKESSGT